MRVDHRILSKFPIIEDVAAFKQQWWKWWTAIQPKWRADIFVNGRPVQRGDGDWLELRKPGKNGLFLALLTLFWWRRLESPPSQDWLDAVLDVRWVMLRLQHNETHPRKRASELSDDYDSERPEKRARV